MCTCCKSSVGVFHYSQAGVQDYETFNEQLDTLGRWIVEAEEALKGQDPNGSSDQSIIQERMEDLKVLHKSLNNKRPLIIHIPELLFILLKFNSYFTVR